MVLPNLGGGGSERVALHLLRGLDRNRFQIHFVVFDGQGPLRPSVPSDINFYDLQASRVRKGIFKFAAWVKEIGPDLIFSTVDHCNLAVLFITTFFSLKIPVIVRESTLISQNIPRHPFPWLWKALFRLLYPRAEKIICSNGNMAEEVISVLKIHKNKIAVIPNPVDVEEIRKKIRQFPDPYPFKDRGPRLVAIGRLSPEKGLDRLIRAFQKLLIKKPGACLWILGEGPDSKRLKYLVKQLQLEDHIFLVGFQADPIPWLHSADLFILSSYYEGSPNVLLEALACEVPVVVLEQKGGAREILERVGLSNRYVHSLDSWSEDWFKKPSPEVKSLLVNHFDRQIVVRRYEKVFQEANKKT